VKILNSSIRQIGSGINRRHIFNVKYIENGERYDAGLKEGQIGNQEWSFD